MKVGIKINIKFGTDIKAAIEKGYSIVLSLEFQVYKAIHIKWCNMKKVFLLIFKADIAYQL